MKSIRPICGFGLAGWIALAILLAVLGLACAGYDFQFHFYMLVYHLFGSGATMWFFQRVHAWHGLLVFEPIFGLLSAAAVVVAWFVHPDNGGWWRCALLVALAITIPALYPYFHPVGRVVFIRFPGGPDSYTRYVLMWTGVNLLVSVLLGLATRSRRTTILIVAATAVVGVYHGTMRWLTPAGYTQFPTPGPLDWMIGPFWHLAVAAALMWWAIAARCQVSRPGHCSSCGYDLRGTNHSHCPECGAPAPLAST